MNTRTLKLKELTVPTAIMAEVGELIGEHNLTNEVLGGSEEDDTILLEIQYDRSSEEEKDVVNQIVELIDEYEEEDENQDDN